MLNLKKKPPSKDEFLYNPCQLNGIQLICCSEDVVQMLILPLTMVQLHLLTQLGKFSVTLTVHLFTQLFHLCSHLLLDNTYLHYVFNHLLLDSTYLHYCIQPLTARRHLPPLCIQPLTAGRHLPPLLY